MSSDTTVQDSVPSALVATRYCPVCGQAVAARFCPSDGLTLETFPDGTPSSLWFACNGWAAAAVLEGLAEHLARTRPGSPA